MFGIPNCYIEMFGSINSWVQMFGVKDIEIIDFSFSKHWNSGLRLFFSKHWNYRFSAFPKIGIQDFGFYKHGNSTELMNSNVWNSNFSNSTVESPAEAWVLCCTRTIVTVVPTDRLTNVLRIFQSSPPGQQAHKPLSHVHQWVNMVNSLKDNLEKYSFVPWVEHFGEGTTPLGLIFR